MLRLIAPENDYSTLRSVPDAEPSLTAAVVIPVYNRVALLVRTLAGLATQTYPRHLWSVVVADDGSTDDVPGAVAEAQTMTGLDITLVRRDHDGYGAGQARTLGAASTGADIVIFIDADCVPDSDLISRHAAWHHKAENLVVIGSRHDLDTSGLDPELLARQGLPPEAREQVSNAPSDFRRVFYRRTNDLRSGDEAFRSLVSSNFSVRRTGFLDVGGFADSFARWGGEDTELGWRLLVAGYFFVPENDAAIFHQTQEDGEEGWRQTARAANDAHIQNLIPHRFYRKSKPGHIYAVPKVTWIVTPAPPERADTVWAEILGQNHTDFEAIFVGEDLESFSEENAADPRLVVVPEVDEALRRARGEYVAIVHGWASVDHRLMARAVRRLDQRPRTSLLTVGYEVPADPANLRFRRPDDVADLDQAWGHQGLPVFAIARRREWSKAFGAPKSVAEAWDIVRAVSESQHLGECLVALPAEQPSDDLPEDFRGFVGDRSALVSDLREAPGLAAALPKVARFVTTRLRDAPYRTQSAPHAVTGSRPPRERPAIRYVGWSGYDNLGDEAMLTATTRLLDWGSLSTSGEATDLLLLGGGTLINRKSYLGILREKDSPRVERAVLGTGVAHPEYWGITEDTKQWGEFLRSCVFVGVRGPRSEALLRDWGYDGQLAVVGDPALALTVPSDSPARDRNRIVISPAWTRGELWGEDDSKVFDALIELIQGFETEGRHVTMLSCFPADDRHIMEMMRRAGRPDLPYLAGYADADAALRLMAGSGLVISERLHGAILAAACGTPFVGLEYQPKLRDFGASIGLERYIVRTDRLGDLPDAITELEANWDAVATTVVDATARFQETQRAASATIRKAVV